jgi:hypothetical protein
VCSCSHGFHVKCAIWQSACVPRALFINAVSTEVFWEVMLRMFPNADRYTHRAVQQHNPQAVMFASTQLLLSLCFVFGRHPVSVLSYGHITRMLIFWL